jgi:hypothetical protein
MAERRLDSLSEKGCSAREPFIFDLGYPPFDLMHKLESLGFTYAVRAPKNFNQDAAAQKEGDGRILLKHAGSDDMAARILKFDLESGEQEILITNLFDERMGIKAFKELYFMRWGVEGEYRLIKSKLQLESFSCKTELPIRQDFFAAAYMANLASADCWEAEAIAEEERAGKNKHLRRTDKTQPLSILSDNFIRLLRTAASRLAGEVSNMIRQMSKETVAWDPKQPGCERKNPRQRRKYSINYKPAF